MCTRRTVLECTHQMAGWMPDPQLKQRIASTTSTVSCKRPQDGIAHIKENLDSPDKAAQAPFSALPGQPNKVPPTKSQAASYTGHRQRAHV